MVSWFFLFLAYTISQKKISMSKSGLGMKEQYTKDRTIAGMVIANASRRIENCHIRFGRTHKVHKRFEGIARGIQWRGPCKRRGGAFVILCDYGNMVKQEHRMVLKQMLEDYSQYVLTLSTTNASPIKKRRKSYQVCRNKAVNSSNDLELLIDGRWVPFGQYMPTPVRELQPSAVSMWLACQTACVSDVVPTVIPPGEVCILLFLFIIVHCPICRSCYMVIRVYYDARCMHHVPRTMAYDLSSPSQYVVRRRLRLRRYGFHITCALVL